MQNNYPKAFPNILHKMLKMECELNVKKLELDLPVIASGCEESRSQDLKMRNHKRRRIGPDKCPANICSCISDMRSNTVRSPSHIIVKCLFMNRILVTLMS
jgi:hypothetical protein